LPPGILSRKAVAAPRAYSGGVKGSRKGTLAI